MKKLAIFWLLMLPIFLFAQVSNDYIAYFPLNGNANDLSTNQLHGIATNVVSIPGVVYDAYRFNGMNSSIIAPNNNRGISDTITITAWVRVLGHNHYGFIAGKYDWRIDKGFHLAVWDNGKAFLAGRNTSGSYIMALSNNRVDDEKWHQITGVIYGNTWELWVDCVLQNTVYGTAQNPNLSNNEALSIGYYPLGDSGNHRYFDGDIDEVYLYNRRLSAPEIQMFCNRNIGAVADNNYVEPIKMFPNPAKQTLHISAGDIIHSLKVYNLEGKIMFQRHFQENKVEIPVHFLPKGIYFVEIVLNNEQRYFKKLILKHN